MVPLWAIGGLMVVISFLWVDNTSYFLFEKIKQLNIAQASARMSLLQGGEENATLALVARAVDVQDSSASYQSYGSVSGETVKQLDNRLNMKRLNQPLENYFDARKSVDVPFTEANRAVGISSRADFSTVDRSVKLLRPLDVVIAVEDTPATHATFNMSRQALMNALTRLYQQAPNSRTFIVPYGWRINQGGRCYTGIARGDDFSFVWWEQFFQAEQRLEMAVKALQTARDSYANALWIISELQSNIALWQNSMNNPDENSDTGSGNILPAPPPDYPGMIADACAQIKDLQISLPQREKQIDDMQGQVKERTDELNRLKDSAQYHDYLPLANHYAINYSNYQQLED